MGKFSLLLILGGLAVGLWLGLNPGTHRQIVRMWQQARDGQVSANGQPLVEFRRLNRQVDRWLGARDEVAPAARPETPRLVTWGEVTNAYEAFRQALQELALRFFARLRVAFR